jgi:hypothetical protein
LRKLKLSNSEAVTPDEEEEGIDAQKVHLLFFMLGVFPPSGTFVAGTTDPCTSNIKDKNTTGCLS